MGNKRDSAAAALRGILSSYGPELLHDLRRTNALLMDCAPKQIRERKIIVSALQEGVGSALLKVLEEDEQERRLCIGRCVHLLITEAWVTEEAARYAVDTIAYALGMEADGAPEAAEDAGQPEPRVLCKGAFDPAAPDLRALLASCQVISYKAFASSLAPEELELPQGIRQIRPRAFVNCVKLRRIALPDSIEEIGEGAFMGCDALETIAMGRNPRYAVVNGMLIDKKNRALMRAAGGVKSQCAIPGEVTVIRSRAFERCHVTEIFLPGKLERIEKNAFYFCPNLQRFRIDGYNGHFSTFGGALYTKDGRQLVRFPTGYPGVSYIIEDSVTHIAEGAFSGTAWLESVTFTDRIRFIGPRAFEFCGKLSSLVLPGSVEHIGERAFQYCEELRSIMLPRGIREIGDYAFCGCSRIGLLSIPKSVRRIGHAAFKDCTGLKRIYLQDSLEFIGDGAFAGCPEDLEVFIAGNSYAEQYCDAHQLRRKPY